MTKLRGKRTKSLKTANPEGRVDVLAYQLTRKLVETKLEPKFPGIWAAVDDILEEEFRKALPSKKLIPKKYMELIKYANNRVGMS